MAGEFSGRGRIRQTIKESHQAGGEFLVSDLELALTMIDRAEGVDDCGARARNLGNAARARDTVERLRDKLDLQPEQSRRIEELLSELARRLEAAREMR